MNIDTSLFPVGINTPTFINRCELTDDGENEEHGARPIPHDIEEDDPDLGERLQGVMLFLQGLMVLATVARQQEKTHIETRAHTYYRCQLINSRHLNTNKK